MAISDIGNPPENIYSLGFRYWINNLYNEASTQYGFSTVDFYRPPNIPELYVLWINKFYDFLVAEGHTTADLEKLDVWETYPKRFKAWLIDFVAHIDVPPEPELTYIEKIQAITDVVYWTFNDDGAGNVVLASNTSFNGVYSGSGTATFQNTLFPKTGFNVATYPTSNKYIEFDTAALDAYIANWDSFTIGAWYRPTRNDVSQEYIWWSRVNAFNADHTLALIKNGTTNTVVTLQISDVSINTGGVVADTYLVNEWNYLGITFQDNGEVGGGKFYINRNGIINSGTHTRTGNRTGFTDAHGLGALNFATTFAGELGIIVITPNYDESAVDTIYDSGI